MTTFAIECQALSKSYRRGSFALADLNLQIEPRQVYGFLGQNGAGKTTTIRLLLDLIRPTTGKAFILGQPVRHNAAALQQVGALVEGASFYPYLSGWDNLEILGRTMGNHNPRRAQNLLAGLGLSQHQQQKVGKYSTGMKQRLGIAAALLHDPAVIILDEPTNGLDPAGIHDLRRFVRQLVDEQGKTVFFSSHLLSEVQQVCDRIAIIHQGKLLAEGQVSELLNRYASSWVTLEVNNAEKAQQRLTASWQVKPGENPNTVLVNAPRDDIPAIVLTLVAAEVDLYGIQRQQNSLEDIFLAITSAEGV